MIPWVRLAAVAAVLAAAFGGGWTVRGWRADAAELARQQAEAKDAHRRAEIALRSAQQFEEDRDAASRALLAAQGRLAAALARPVPQCPAVSVGDVVVPAAAVRLLRDAAGDDGGDPGEPRPAVPTRAGAP